MSEKEGLVVERRRKKTLRRSHSALSLRAGEEDRSSPLAHLSSLFSLPQKTPHAPLLLPVQSTASEDAQHRIEISRRKGIVEGFRREIDDAKFLGRRRRLDPFRPRPRPRLLGRHPKPFA